MHKSVLLQEAIKFLAPKEGEVFVDATLGAGGHAAAILKKIGTRGVLVAIDKDERALELAKKKLIGSNIIFARGDFKDIEEIVEKSGFKKVDGIIADLGVSSMQLDEGERGFSFKKPARLDMRMDRRQKLTAEEVVNTYDEKELVQILREYGEEEQAKKIAAEIVRVRNIEPIIWTDQLSEVVRRVKKTKTKIDPATKTFQAIRIEVNGELTALREALPQMVRLLKPNARMAVITFHSLEDRIVKNFIDQEAKTCVCPPEFPKCICDKKALLKKTSKAIKPSAKEVAENPRARSAKLRVAEKIEN